MSAGGFEATFTVRVSRRVAWQRLTATPAGEGGEHLWLPGFDSSVTVDEAEPSSRLRATKDDEPCAGTEIIVTLEDADTGTRIRVVQSRFGEWLASRREMMSVGWRSIVADLQTYLATGIHAGRFLRPWGDLGADATSVDGGLLIARVRPDGLASRLGLADGDLLVMLAGAPLVSLDDLVTVLRVCDPVAPGEAVWIRSGSLMATTPAAGT